MIMIVIGFALVKFYAFAILYVLIVMQIKLVVVVIVPVLGIIFDPFNYIISLSCLFWVLYLNLLVTLLVYLACFGCYI